MQNYDDFLMDVYESRERMVADQHRPRFHFLPPEGRWNDLNGTIYWNGRYHIGYLQKIANGPGERDFSSWQHISSRDLLHWTYHKASLREPLEGKKGDYFNSGDAMEGCEVPTIITNMPRKGICIYQCHDDRLDHWVPLDENPVIPIDAGWNRVTDTLKPDAPYPECVIFDPSGWKEGDTYYALIGNKNHRPGYEGDSTSLFKSKDLRSWEYVGPFYKSDRKWTDEVEDCACSDFFPFGDRYMLVMHTHKPFPKCQYYIGRYENEQFYPEENGQLSYLGGLLAGPETLVDDRGRRIFWGWIREGRSSSKYGWGSIMTLPWHFIPDANNRLEIRPIEELQALRFDERAVDSVRIKAGQEIVLEALSGSCMELKFAIDSGDTNTFGFKLLCSPDSEEETVITYDGTKKEFVIDFSDASLADDLAYPMLEGEAVCSMKQIVPFEPRSEGLLRFHVFVDRSVMEIFVNSQICMVQRVYPTREDSDQVRVFASDGSIVVSDIMKWEMDATNPW